MAKIFLTMLLVLAVSMACFAEERTLSAHVTSSTTLGVSNCAPTTGPTKALVNIFIENQLPQFMEVNYEFFNNNTGTWQRAGKLCNAPSGEFMQCTGTMELTLGGKGNGTFTADLLRLRATTEAAPNDVYVKVMPFTINHYTGEREQSLTSQMREQDAALTSAQTACSNSPGCCPQAIRDSIDSAATLLSEARVAVSACDLTGMYSKIVSAESLLDNAATAIDACLASATPTPVATPAGTPHGTPTPSGTPQASVTPTPTQTAAPSPTPAPQASACPVGAGILLALAGFATISKAR